MAHTKLLLLGLALGADAAVPPQLTPLLAAQWVAFRLEGDDEDVIKIKGDASVL